MAKYADITPFYEWLEDLMRLDTSNYPDHNTLMFYEIMDELDSLPEVVRCKDCKYGMKSHLQPRHAKNYLCRHSWEGEYHEPEHFCSYGERKDNG